jgi:hypothetical protein
MRIETRLERRRSIIARVVAMTWPSFALAAPHTNLDLGATPVNNGG